MSEVSSVQDNVIGPIALQPIVQERIWGVEHLPVWYAQPAPGKTIGEVWLTAETCVAANGPLAAKSLAEIVKLHPEPFGGGPSAEFPLLIKVLLPREKLSVQVHPNDIQAQAMGLPRGKTECWYILSAEPGAAVAVGFRRHVSLDEIRMSIEDGTLEDKLNYLPVKAGDMVYVDAGTVHAIGPGMVVLETQQYSDVTYRLYDYGRPRDLHVQAGLAVSRTVSDAGLVAPVTMKQGTRLVSSPYFDVDRLTVAKGMVLELEKADAMQLLVALGDGCSVRSALGSTPLPPGCVVVLPAEAVSYALVAHNDIDVMRIVQP